MLIRIFFLLSSLIVSLEAAEISWRSTPFETNETSQGNSLTSEWTFHLGFFEAGFVPSPTNTSQWSQNWNTLDVSAYSDSFDRFVGVWEDDGTVPDGSQGYIWGFNRGSLTPEWILMSESEWTFPLPVASPLDPTGGQVVWDVDSANQVPVGQVNQGGIHMRTGSVSGTPPLLEGDLWLALHFSEGELQNSDITGFLADPDQDGFTNLQEFAFGTNPRVSDSPEICANVVSGVFEFTVTRPQTVGVIYAGQVSSELESWQSGPSNVQLVSETAQSLTYRDMNAANFNQRFWSREGDFGPVALG